MVIIIFNFQTAFVEENYAQTNTDNLFLQPFTNTFQGNNSSVGLTAPLVISNSQTSNKASLYIDDANNLDATLYSNQPDGGITIRNAGGFSFTVAPLGANTATFANPISCGTFPLTCGALSATSMTGSSVNISGTVNCGTVNTNTLGVTGNIVSGGSISGTSLILGGTTLSNASGTFASTTTITAPTQTYNSGTTYANILSTQSFVQQALSSQGGGDVYLNGNNPFTGNNTFSAFCGTSVAQTYPISNANQFTTNSYITNLFSTNYSNQLRDGSNPNAYVQIVDSSTFLKGYYLGSTLIQFTPLTFNVVMIITGSVSSIPLTLINVIGNLPITSISLTGSATNNETLQTCSLVYSVATNGTSITATGSTNFFTTNSSTGSYTLTMNGTLRQSP